MDQTQFFPQLIITLSKLNIILHNIIPSQVRERSSICVLGGIDFASFYDFAILQVSLVEQEQLTLREHLSSPPVFSGVRVTRYLVLYVCFVDRYLSFCSFSFGHCVVCSSSIYGFWLPLWYLQTLLTRSTTVFK